MEHLTLVASRRRRAPARVKATEDLDRGVSSPHFSEDGKSIVVLVTDDRPSIRLRVDARGEPRRAQSDAAARRRVERDHARARARRPSPAATRSRPRSIAWSRRRQMGARRSSRIRTTRCSASCSSGQTEEVTAKSKDGTEVHGLLTKPVNYVAGTKSADAAADPRRPERPGSAHVQHSSGTGSPPTATPCSRSTIAAAPAAARSSRSAICADWGHYEVDDLLADGRSGRQDGRRGSEQARRRRLELRRHPHRLHDRQRHALQGGDQRRRHRVHRRLLRHRSVHHSVRLRDRPAVGSEGVGDLPEDLVSVPARRSHQDADAVPRRREATSTCRCRAGSRCTRRCAASASTRSW